MNKTELRKLMKKENTIHKARKEVQGITRYLDNYELYVRCYTTNDNFNNIVSTDLYVEVYNGEDYHTIVLATIEVEEDKIDYWEFQELTNDIFKTMKKNMIKELEKYNYEITNTEDYSI